MADPAHVPTSRPMDAWLDALSEPNGSPGGGAATGVLLGVAAALMGMVAAYTPDSPAATTSAERLARHRADVLQAIEADGVLSVQFGSALALAPEHPERDQRVSAAAVDAAGSVARLGAIGILLVSDARVLASNGNPHIAVDLAVAMEALAAGLSGAALSLRANLQIGRTHGADAATLASLETDVRRLDEARQEVAQLIRRISADLD
ncbi:cyclodeaminase/cyclohydrolase family protein [Microbacterium esteraromaticum]|uniref:cyclodeaminase/cyclohydrolase family protein n=1 Tax=Microbacterium esteraromaticum TaxID=57043 RepID=UPI0019594AEE|nr:cyclodeaminase/cyclohydrolase family protein [Microbacterium esteraromaticum]MBM7466490.1 formiminotetrahydrofolate cyclodeaminase [Microbacterium esteraromaticum]